MWQYFMSSIKKYKKSAPPCLIGLLLWGSSCLFRFSNLLHLRKQQQNAAWLAIFLSYFIIFFCFKKTISCQTGDDTPLFFLSHWKIWFFGYSKFLWNNIISIIFRVLCDVIKFLISLKMVVLSTTGIDSLKKSIVDVVQQIW